MNGGVADTLLLFNTTPRPNLNSGQDTRANRTRHTTSSSTQPHAKQQPTNAPQTNLTFTRTHTPPDRRTMPINRRHRPASQPHSLSHPHARAHSPWAPRRSCSSQRVRFTMLMRSSNSSRSRPINNNHHFHHIIINDHHTCTSYIIASSVFRCMCCKGQGEGRHWGRAVSVLICRSDGGPAVVVLLNGII